VTGLAIHDAVSIRRTVPRLTRRPAADHVVAVASYGAAGAAAARAYLSAGPYPA